MFSDYVLRIYASQNAPVTPSCPWTYLNDFGRDVLAWGGGGVYPRERQNDVLKHKSIYARSLVVVRNINGTFYHFI